MFTLLTIKELFYSSLKLCFSWHNLISTSLKTVPNFDKIGAMKFSNYKQDLYFMEDINQIYKMSNISVFPVMKTNLKIFAKLLLLMFSL